MRFDENGKPRSQSNEAGMEQKDHILRIARGVASNRESFEKFIGLLEIYVDCEDESVLDDQKIYRYWIMGGAREKVNGNP